VCKTILPEYGLCIVIALGLEKVKEGIFIIACGFRELVFVLLKHLSAELLSLYCFIGTLIVPWSEIDASLHN